MNEPEDREIVRLRRILERGLGIPFTEGNTVEPLRNGDRIFPAMLEAIDGARDSIRMLTFIYWKGDIARRFASALAKRARAGVRVQILLDAVGCLPMPTELVETMQKAGVDVRKFHEPTKEPGALEHRTHRKVLVCDGSVGFTGGVGIATEWEGDARGPDEWRETHFRVRGPAVRGLEGAFLDNWLETGAALEVDAVHGPVPPDAGEPAGPSRVQVVRSNGGERGSSDAHTLARLLIASAQQRLRIATAYFIPGDEVTEDLCQAARRGVAVDVMLPGEHTDHELCNLAGGAYFQTLLDAGVRVWTYEHTMLHVKVATVDECLSYVGSPNFNQRSMSLDDEVGMVVLDRAVTALLDAHFEEDLSHSRAIDPEAWEERGLFRRAKESLAGIFRSRL